ncbi:LLM class flavin-dependent oxidoreductase [Streptomyces sp. NPDC002490]|uniref:LLM class flavin-dependent oxidoreductase n=1 Tax=Streptomyces sp. NPDC002490 TaxID=3154416 RepID=UPI00332AB60F
MRLSTVILPIHRWAEGQKTWRRAEELGFHTAYTYDHLSWRTFRDGPWFGALPTLTAAATVTDRLRLGTLVTSVKPFSPIAAPTGKTPSLRIGHAWSAGSGRI